jgi:hypothetical protein
MISDWPARYSDTGPHSDTSQLTDDGHLFAARMPGLSSGAAPVIRVVAGLVRCSGAKELQSDVRRRLKVENASKLKASKS